MFFFTSTSALYLVLGHSVGPCSADFGYRYRIYRSGVVMNAYSVIVAIRSLPIVLGILQFLEW
jgi:hypothetical protein